MGYSYTNTAGETLEFIAKTYKLDGDESSNTIKLNSGQWGFFEISRKDQSDGGISGSVQRGLTEEEKEYWKTRGVNVDTAVFRAGSFKIAGSGKVVRFAGLPVKEINKELGYA